MAKDLKKLSKEIVLAIDWAAAEYKYLEEFKQELTRIEIEKEFSAELKELKKASKLLKYISKAEQMSSKIIEGLDLLRVNHGHLHEGNFCVEFQEGRIRLYAIDFDQAVS